MKAAPRPKYDEASARRWLSWLAREMQQRGATIFMIEDLQPACLGGGWRLGVYLLLSRLVPVLCVGIVVGIQMEGPTSSDAVFVGTGIGLWWAAMTTLALGDAFRWWSQRSWHRITRSVCLAAMVGVMTWLTWHEDDLDLVLLISCTIGLVLGATRPRTPLDDVWTIERFRWSWRRAAPVAGLGLTVTIFLIAFSKGLDERVEQFLGWDSFFTLKGAIVVVFGLLLGLSIIVLGITRGILRDVPELRVSPNQGIRTTIKYSALFGVAVALLFGVVFALWIVRNDGLAETIANPGIFSGIVGFSLFSGAFGSLAVGSGVIRHATIRFVLWVTGAAPLRLARFLDHAAMDLQLLQKVGGGYIFVHRMVLEFFADLESRSPRPGGKK